MGQHVRVFQFQGLRDRQEDYHAVVSGIPSRDGSPLYAAAVFDGVGGSTDGNYAAGIAAATFPMAVLRMTLVRGVGLPLHDLAVQALLQVNEPILKLRRLNKYSIVHPDLRPAAVGTVAVLSPSSRRLAVAYAGDVIAFLQQRDQLLPITNGQAGVEEQTASGMVTQFLGQDGLRPQVVIGDFMGESLWLMTDGAYGALLASKFAGDPGDFFKNATEDLFWDNATAVGVSLVPEEKCNDPTPAVANVGAIMDVKA